MEAVQPRIHTIRQNCAPKTFPCPQCGQCGRRRPGGARIRDAIALVPGRVYTAEQSPDLYPTTATSEDYAFTRHFVDPAKPRVRGLTVETGQEFQPAFPEAANVMNEGAVAVLEACLINLDDAEVAMAAAPHRNRIHA